MKKFLAIFLAAFLIFSLVACLDETPVNDTNPSSNNGGNNGADNSGNKTPGGDTVTVLTYAEYMAAEIDTEVVIEAYVQAHQSWWDNKITVYAQDKDGAYFLYNMACSEEDSAKLTPGTKIRVSGVKTEWSGEVEIIDATFEIIEGDTWTATAFDATEILANETELIKHQNELVAFKGLEIAAISYKNDQPGDDIYVTVKQGEKTYEFCVEVYLTGTSTDVYTTVGTLNVGDIVDIEGFLYWYEGVNTHITSIALATAE